VYQLLPPAWPGLRQGKVIIEQRRDGTLKVKFKQRDLPFEAVNMQASQTAETIVAKTLVEKTLGALPQTPGVYRSGGYP
jgi:hypothetical protein